MNIQEYYIYVWFFIIHNLEPGRKNVLSIELGNGVLEAGGKDICISQVNKTMYYIHHKDLVRLVDTGSLGWVFGRLTRSGGDEGLSPLHNFTTWKISIWLIILFIVWRTVTTHTIFVIFCLIFYCLIFLEILSSRKITVLCVHMCSNIIVTVVP